jgi:hypothetical protein
LTRKNPYQQSIPDEELIFDKVVLINNDPYSVTEGLGMDLSTHVRKTPYFELTLQGTLGTLIKLLRSSLTNMKNVQIKKKKNMALGRI